MILYIDSTDFNSVTYAIVSNSPPLQGGARGGLKVLKKTYKVDPYKAYENLGKLEEFLKSAKVNINEVKKIIISKGPGSYTGTRVGISHALGISLALNIPIKALEKTKYEKEFKKL